MPRRVITAPGHSRKRSLGWLATWWIETFTLHGAGGMTGKAVKFGDEYTGFITDVYALDENGRRLYDSAFLSRPKGCDKSGLAAKIVLFEAFGPARFAGWAKGGEKYEWLGRTYIYRAGEPMGRKVHAPVVRILATEEEQTGNTYGTVYYNLTSSAAPLFALQAYGVNPGKTRTVIAGGGEIVRSTSGAASKDGGLETFAVFDETHLYNRPELRQMYATVVDNLGKRADAEPWYIETTTMYAPGEESVAESTYQYADLISEGRARKPRLFFDHRWGEVVDLRNEEKLRAAFIDAYGDAIVWNPVEGLVEKAYDARRSEDRTRRYRLNAITDAKNAWAESAKWKSRGRLAARRREQQSGKPSGFVRPWDGDTITIGFDGARSNDATALVGCRVSDRYIFPILIEEAPDGPEAKDWVVDHAKVDAAVAKTFERYNVVGFYADPPYWLDYVTAWDREYGDDLEVKSSGKSAIAWYTKRDTQMAEALELLELAIGTGDMGHDDATPLGKTLTRHILNARKWSRRGGTVIGKEGKNSPRKIDAAVAAALAFQAASDYDGRKPAEESPFIPFAIR